MVELRCSRAKGIGRPNSPGALSNGSTTVEAAIVVPVLMVLLLAAVQMCLWVFADEAVQSVASHAAVVAAGTGGTAVLGQEAGQASAAQLAGPVLENPVVAVVVVGDSSVEVEVAGHVESILPWWRPTVRAVRMAVLQQFRESS